MSVSGTEHLTKLVVLNNSTITTPFPALREFEWRGETLSVEAFPGALTVPALFTVRADMVDATFPFPAHLPSLVLAVRDSVDVALLTPLTRLRDLDINTDKGNDPLDLSPLTMLTRLNTNKSAVSGLPTSLVECVVSLQSDADLSPLTNLTSLELCLAPRVRVTFPTGLKTLSMKGLLDNTNVGDVALESFYSMSDARLTRRELEKLPKTLKTIGGRLEPGLMLEVGAMFPRFEGRCEAAQDHFKLFQPFFLKF